jgi:hypothetical protein
MSTELIPPWHYTTVLDLLDHWQALIAGVLALVAAGIAVIGTLWVERRKAAREVEALRKSLAAELRVLIPRALSIHNSLVGLAKQTQGSVTARTIENLSRIPPPTVFLNSASNIGTLGADAQNIMLFYATIQSATTNVDKLMWHQTPDDISRTIARVIGDMFLLSCRIGRDLLPNFRNPDPEHVDLDDQFIAKVNDAISESERYPLILK